MTISKLPFILCALVIGALCLTVRAEDNPAQAAARMALAKQQFEQNAQPATNAPAPAAKPMPPVKSKKAKAEKPVAPPQARPAAQAPAVVARPAPEPAPVAGDNSAQAAARMALGQQLGMPTTPSPVVNNTGVTTPESASAKPVPTPPALLYTPTAPANNNYVGQNLGLKPIVAPGLPINTSKQARLQALLERYKADQITPEEYHKQRAAILAEP